MVPYSGFPEFNPLRFPPCSCARCRETEPLTPVAREDSRDSPLLRRLRERVAVENGLRGLLRRAGP